MILKRLSEDCVAPVDLCSYPGFQRGLESPYLAFNGLDEPLNEAIGLGLRDCGVLRRRYGSAVVFKRDVFRYARACSFREGGCLLDKRIERVLLVRFQDVMKSMKTNADDEVGQSLGGVLVLTLGVDEKGGANLKRGDHDGDAGNHLAILTVSEERIIDGRERDLALELVFL